MINQTFHELCKKNDLDSHFKDSVASTNDWAKSEFDRDSQKPQVFMAEKQLQGRGRFDRKWIDAELGGQLFTTWVYPVGSIAAYSSVAVGIALHQNLFPQSTIKLPNDILNSEGKKICGILCEAISNANKNFLFVGVGINLSSAPGIDDAASFLTSDTDIKVFMKAYFDAMRELPELLTRDILTYQDYLCRHAIVAGNNRVTGIKKPLSIETSAGSIPWSEL